MAFCWGNGRVQGTRCKRRGRGEQAETNRGASARRRSPCRRGKAWRASSRACAGPTWPGSPCAKRGTSCASRCPTPSRTPSPFLHDLRWVSLATTLVLMVLAVLLQRRTQELLKRRAFLYGVGIVAASGGVPGAPERAVSSGFARAHLCGGGVRRRGIRLPVPSVVRAVLPDARHDGAGHQRGGDGAAHLPPGQHAVFRPGEPLDLGRHRVGAAPGFRVVRQRRAARRHGACTSGRRAPGEEAPGVLALLRVFVRDHRHHRDREEPAAGRHGARLLRGCGQSERPCSQGGLLCLAADHFRRARRAGRVGGVPHGVRFAAGRGAVHTVFAGRHVVRPYVAGHQRFFLPSWSWFWWPSRSASASA